MCGVKHSVLGVDKDIIIKKFYTEMPAFFNEANGECTVNGIVAEIDPSTGKALSIERINF